jgi:hypothetical protein
VTTWTFIWLMVLLKIPIVALFLLVRWAVREPETTTDEDGGIGVGGVGEPPINPSHPYHPRPRRGGRGPITPRRSPHGDPVPSSPRRMRVTAKSGRLVQR